MKTNLLQSTFNLIFLAIFVPCSAQFSDSFDDGDFINHPEWKGDSGHFVVNANYQLQLKAPAVTGKSFLYTPSSASVGAVWNFWLQTDFNPSSGNYAKVYLMADKPKPDTVNGYFLRLGSTADDICLFRQDGVSTRMIVDGRNGMLNASVNRVRVKVSRAFNGEWTILCDTAGNTDYSLVGTGIDSTYCHSRYFAIQCIYTSTRSTRFMFDDFKVSGKPSADTIPPVLKEWQMTSENLLALTFSELIALPLPGNFILSTGLPVQSVSVEGNTCLIVLPGAIPCKSPAELKIEGIQDLTGNVSGKISLQLSWCPGKLHDVLITEIMADPDPPVYLPNVEYVELFNRSGMTLNLEKWILQAGNSKIVLPAIQLPPDSFLLICAAKSCSLFGSLKFCADLLPANSLNNAGTYLGLKNRQGTLIHWVNYDESYYRDGLKSSGGWSLEMIDTHSPCIQQANWKASNHYRGGTPGAKNSGIGTVTDIKPFQVLNFDLPEDHILRLYFSKLPSLETLLSGKFQINGNKLLDLKADSSRNMFIDLVYSQAFSSDKEYSLQLMEDIKGCAGEALQMPHVITFMKPKTAQPGIILINEVMFDSPPGGQEFIEIYNNSAHHISSNGLMLAYKGSSAQYNTSVIGENPFVIPPGSFRVLVKNPESFSEFYPSCDFRNTVPCRNIPSLNNNEGCIALMDRSLQVLDEFCYSSKMHHPLLANKSGVSLERIRYSQPSGDGNNWHSAASTHGFATPGTENSQYLGDSNPEDEFIVEFEIFSPDNDGYRDVQTLFYKLDQTGFVANIIVFDAMGRRVKVLANNKTLGVNGTFTWDGIDEKGRLAQTGIYLIYIGLHHPSGIVRQFRKTCVLGGTKR